MKRLGIGLVIALALTGCGGSDEPAKPKTFTAAGTFTLKQITLGSAEGYSCSGRDGFADIRVGTQVVVRDAAGKKVGIGELEDGRQNATGWCELPFTVTGIPISDGVYSVEVSKRGEIAFKRADAKKLELTLG